METRNSRNPEALRIRRQRISYFGIRFSLFILLLAGGCGAPGEPTPPSPPVPVAVTDLAAQQAGDAVQLTFTMPPKTVAGEHLAETPAIEILRGALKPDGSPDAKSFRTIETIPGALVGDHRTADKVQVINRISPDELRAYPGAALAYRVRTRASRKRASADSNTVTVRIRPVPERITSVHPEVTESATELSWSAPTRTSAGDPLPTISEYRVYRGEIDAASAAAAANDLSQAKWKSPLAFLASSPTNSYRLLLPATFSRPPFRKAWSHPFSSLNQMPHSRSISPGPSTLKPTWRVITSIEVSSKTRRASFLLPICCSPRRIVIRLYSPVTAIGTP